MNKENNMSKKHYRVEKDTPLWEKGAILQHMSISGSRDGGYRAISDLWDATKELGDEYLSVRIVEAEDNSTFFVRVYDVNILGKVKYLVRDDAKKAQADLHTTK